jgi:deazaflavin-dependent oxidoreductase (nitroreductase family)
MVPDGWTDATFYYVTTTGRRTGRPHEIEIWCVAVGGALYLMAGSGERSDTVRNLLASPDVTVRVGSETRAAVATVVRDEGEAAPVRAAMVAKYATAADDLSGWSVSALPVRLDLST